jgi:hypothetical protein
MKMTKTKPSTQLLQLPKNSDTMHRMYQQQQYAATYRYFTCDTRYPITLTLSLSPTRSASVRGPGEKGSKCFGHSATSLPRSFTLPIGSKCLKHDREKRQNLLEWRRNFCHRLMSARIKELRRNPSAQRHAADHHGHRSKELLTREGEVDNRPRH